MLRKIIHIDEKKCNGCGACAEACHEGAIAMIHGKATLIRDDYCDGLGDCLPSCPTDAIKIITRQAPAYDAQAVERNQQKKASACPGQAMRTLPKEKLQISTAKNIPSQLAQWPCQIKLVPVRAPFFDGAHLLIAADCTAYAYANLHQDFMHGRITIIGCPKLDAVDYSEKLTEILQNNDILSVTVVRMEVPCCGGIELATKKALKDSLKTIPYQIVTITIDGQIENEGESYEKY